MMKNIKRGGGKRSSDRGGYSFNKQPLPDQMCVTLRYADSDDVTASFGVFSWIIRGNGPQDPDATFVGVQPPCFDQWAALYGRYTVESSRITVRAISRAVSNCMRIAVAPQAVSTAGSFDGIAGYRYAVSKDTTGGAPAAVLTCDVKTSKVLGVPSQSVRDSASAAFDSAVNTLPTTQWYWNIAVETSGSSDSVSVYFVVEYRVRFWQPLSQDVSLTHTLKRAPRVRRVTSTHQGVTATAVPEKPTESSDAPRGGPLVTDPVIHLGCQCPTCAVHHNH